MGCRDGEASRRVRLYGFKVAPFRSFQRTTQDAQRRAPARARDKVVKRRGSAFGLWLHYDYPLVWASAASLVNAGDLTVLQKYSLVTLPFHYPVLSSSFSHAQAFARSCAVTSSANSKGSDGA